MKYKTFLEVMMGSGGDLNLSVSQKRVLQKVNLSADDPRMAATTVINAEDSRNLIAATKQLARFGYLTTEPTQLGQDEEPTNISLTDKGTEAIETNGIMDDPELQTDKEKEESQPTGDDIDADAEVAPEEGEPEDNPAADLEGGGVGLELSSFFHDINDLAKLKK